MYVLHLAFVSCYFVVKGFVQNMDVILDELQRNSVDIDMKTLSYHITQCLEHHESTFRKMHASPRDLTMIFHEIKVNNFGRAISYLTFVYMMKHSEEVTRGAVQLCATALKAFDFREFKIEESLIRKVLATAKRFFNA